MGYADICRFETNAYHNQLAAAVGRENQKENWIDERVASILADDDYVMELGQTVAEDHPEVMLALYKATTKDFISALASYHYEVAKAARHMAIGEAARRFA